MSYQILYVLVVATIIAGAGALAVCVYALAEALRDRRAIIAAGVANGRRLIVRRSVHTETIRTTVVACLVGGLIALLVGEDSPDPISSREAVAVTTALTLCLYSAAVALLAVDAIGALTSRRRIDRELAEQHQELAAEEPVELDAGSLDEDGEPLEDLDEG